METILLLTMLVAQVPDEDPIAEMRRINNYGVDQSKIEKGEKYFFNGSLVSRDTAIKKVSGIPDDSTLLRITIIGTKEQREIVVNDLKNNPAFNELREKFVVQDYPPDHWAVKDVGFYTAGSPTIYVQQPDGVVIHRQDDYSDGADGLATALRKSDPNYRREGDPDLRRTIKSSLLLFALCGAAFALIVLFRREEDV